MELTILSTLSSGLRTVISDESSESPVEREFDQLDDFFFLAKTF
jgi:hypothetical protein